MTENMIIDLKKNYGLSWRQADPVSGGWMNQKWRIVTEQGEFLVKEFSKERFSEERLALLEDALQRQVQIKGEGVPCPQIRQIDGRVIRRLADGTAYMVMAFCSGEIEDYQTVSMEQMHSLGEGCGLMHRGFSKLPVHSAAGYPLSGEQVIRSLQEHFLALEQLEDSEIIGQSGEGEAAGEYLEAMALQRHIMGGLTKDFLEDMPKGIGHEDFSFDNILFYPDSLSAIIDFDRNCYTFIGHDVGRAILSFALKEGQMAGERIEAFVEGYSQYFALQMADIAPILRLTWCMEAAWWIRPEVFQKKKQKIVRFKDEMLWLMRNWDSLDELIKG